MSIRSLAKANDCGIDTIRTAVLELETHGYLIRSEQKHDKNGQFIDFDWITSDPTQNTVTGFHRVGETGHKEEQVFKEEQELKNINPQSEFEDKFVQFWNVYPRKNGKQDAIKAFDKAVKTFGFDVVLAGAIRFAHDPNLPSKEFIPYPATWLNRGSWDDEPLPERTKTLDEVRSDEVEISRQKLARDRELTQQLIAEQPKTGTPPPECKHGNIIIKCRKCLLGID
jgi:hypothetical protein